MILTDNATRFRDELVEAGLLFPTELTGLFLRSATYESVLAGVHRVITEVGASERPQQFFAPLLIPKSILEQTDYVRSFPDLLGTVDCFIPDQRTFTALLGDLEQDVDWTARLSTTDLALASAACHSIYPTIRETLPSSGTFYEIQGHCFRHEPSDDPFRQQAFHMHEQVFVGTPEDAHGFWETWIDRLTELFGERLELPIDAVVANDPFFGRTGALLAANQRDEVAKIEFVLPVYSDEPPTAITSVNRHREHFGVAFGLRTEDGAVAHSSCVGFGVDRIALALLHTHGLAPSNWPATPRAALGL